MSNLKQVLNKLNKLETIDAKEKEITLDTPAGVIAVTYQVAPFKLDSQFPLQVILRVVSNNVCCFSWGAMSNEENSDILKYFRQANEVHLLKQRKQEKQAKKDFSLLFNL